MPDVTVSVHMRDDDFPRAFFHPEDADGPADICLSFGGGFRVYMPTEMMEAFVSSCLKAQHDALDHDAEPDDTDDPTEWHRATGAN